MSPLFFLFQYKKMKGLYQITSTSYRYSDEKEQIKPIEAD